MFICLFFTTLLFTLAAYYMHLSFGSILVKKYGVFILIFVIMVLISTVLWFILAAAIIEIEFPYTAIQNNNTIVHGTHVWGDSTAVSLMYLFIMMGSIQIVFGIGSIPFYVIDYFRKRYIKKMEE